MLTLAVVGAFIFLVPGAHGVLEITVTDALVADQSALPSATDPGPILYDTSDGLTFSSGLTNIDTIWYAQLASVTNNSSATSATVQGTVHTFSDWFYARQGSAASFADLQTTGAYDADAAAYSVPLLFTKSSQGSLVVTSYDASSPTDGGTQATYHWAYDASTNRYVIGTTKDLSLETQLAPVSDLSGVDYARTLEANSYVVTTVGAAPDYVPTVTQGFHLPLLSLPTSKTWYLLMDAPAGAHEDTYTYVLQVNARGL